MTDSDHAGLSHPAYGRLRQVTATAAVLLCDNPGQMTLDGTNTWILRAPGSRELVVLDPGPDDPAHLARIAALGEVALTLVSHRHGDHTDGLSRFRELTGSPVYAVDPAFRSPDGGGLTHGQRFAAAGVELEVLATPGHTADSISVLLRGSGPDDPGAVLTADTVLGRGTTVLDPQDGDLGDYLDSLELLIDRGAGRVCLPGHGPELPDTSAVATHYREHRRERLAQVRAAVETLGADAEVGEVVAQVYRDVDPSLWGAARWSVEVQLRYLRRRG